ncbi:hypothetical protein BCR44DRAFT_56694 [Catenaria anguillulae PL171]|uniref:Uncharacterized protein n=1 Tax=Catenaria anguillulae PL171 TaxID=765915 RepID=A0A1Y2HHN3_9FUNG|nr:hypothetical protein BCR44DRAFT_56694 [Catenaria anguillulae PL171]
MTQTIRKAVLAAWTDIQQLTGPPHAITESTHDMNVSTASATSTTSATASSAPLLSESDLFHRFLSTPERHQLLSRPNRPKCNTTTFSSCSKADFDNGPGFQSTTMNLVDPGSATNGPLTADRSQHLFARGSVSAIRQHLVPVRKPIPSPNQIPVRLDAALKSVKTELVPYFESAEGRAALVELAKTRDQQAQSPRRPHSPRDTPSKPLYSSGPPIDLSEDLLADLDPLADLQRVHTGQVESVPNPFTRGPKLPPRPNRASSLRKARVADVALGHVGKRQCFKSLGLPSESSGNSAAGQVVYGRHAGTGLSATSIEGIADAAATLATAATTPAGSGGLIFAPPVVRATRGKQKANGDGQDQPSAKEWRGRGEFGASQLATPSRLDVL